MIIRWAAPFWLLLTVLMLAVNLRAPLAAVAPLTGDIQAALGWNDVAIGVLTTLPVLCMGLLAPAVPVLLRRAGMRTAVAIGLILMVVAMLARLVSASLPWVLYVSALAVGASIAILGGLVPGLVVRWFPRSVGMATGAYVAAMMAGAAVAGALSVPLAGLLSWQAALAVWSVPAAVALVIWLPVSRAAGTPESVGSRRVTTVESGTTDSRPVSSVPSPDRVRVRSPRMPWRDPVAWSLTAYLTLNSLVFYSLLAWLAPSYDDRGWTATEAGLLFGVFTVAQLLAALVGPPLVARLTDPRPAYAGTVGLTAVTLVLAGTVPQTATVLVLVVLGAVLGAGFGYGLTLLAAYAKDAEASTRLTAMAFLVAFSIGALGPVGIGALAGSGWSVAYLMLAGVSVAQLATVPLLRRGVVID